MSVRRPIKERLLEFSRRDENGCLAWIGAVNHRGYGRLKIAGKTTSAHRASYVEWVGPIPLGLDVDHLCGNRACIEPAHLEAVTHRENVLRSSSGSGMNARKTHCIRGHKLPPYGVSERRTCHTCRNEPVECSDCGHSVTRRHIKRHVREVHS